MNAPSKDIHDSVIDEIDEQIETLQSGALTSSSDRSAWTQDEIDAKLAELGSDRNLLIAHWKTQTLVSPKAAGERTRSLACGQPQPCAEVKDLAQKYGV